MTKLFVCLAMYAAVAAAAIQNSPQPALIGTIQGTVARDGTNDPISDVQISLSGKSALPPSLSAVTDSSGHFSINNVPVGDIIVRAQLKGYFGPVVNGVSPTFVSMPAAVTAGHTTDIHLSIIPGGNFSGRVTDSNGKPISDLLVLVLRRGYSSGRSTLQQVTSKNTDDRGEYRLDRLPPGEYFVAASPPRTGAPSATSTASSAQVPVMTLYPHVTDPSQAIPITLKGGEELTGVNLQLMTGAAATISGKVTYALPPSADGNREPIVTVSVGSHDPDAFRDFSRLGGGMIANAADGTFQILNVASGTYDLFARMPALYGWGASNPPERASAAWAIGRTTFDVGGSNVENINVVINSGVDVTGRVMVDGTPSSPNLRLSLMLDDAINSADRIIVSVADQISSYQVRIRQDGSFTFPVLPPGRYRFAASIGGLSSAGVRGQAQPGAEPLPLPQNAYIADIRQDDFSVYDNGLVVGTQMVNPPIVIVKTDGGIIEGSIVASDRKQPTIAESIVVLIPPENQRQNPARFRTVQADSQGHFVMSAVPPGKYQLFAWENLMAGAYQNSEFMRKYEGRGVPLIVSADSRIVAEVPLIN